MKKIEVDGSLCQTSMLHLERINEKDLPLIRQLGIRDWNGKEFNEDLLVKYGNWIVNDDRSVIFKALGGGSFEVPEMYDLIYKGKRIRLECGGGGFPAWRFVKHDDQVIDGIVSVSRVSIPSDLSHEQESVLALAAEAFAVHFLRCSKSKSRLTIEFAVR